MDQGEVFGEAPASLNQQGPLWSGFDAAWYRRRYAHQLAPKDAALDDKALHNYWETNEAAKLTAPNRYFDEAWYLEHYPDVRRNVQEQGIFRNGFQHYAEVGNQSCAGHWLFSAEYYLKENHDYGFRALRKAGYANAYDHFLAVGDKQFRSPHVFFEPEILIRSCLAKDIPFDPSQGTFSQYLSLDDVEMGTVRTSWYFDPAWYVETYPQVKALIEQGLFINPLHHYLCCDEPQSFNPNPYFDESYYLEQYPDIREAVAQGAFRNGYAHFMRSGIRELRNPSAEVDMRAFAAGLDMPRDLHQAHVANIFQLLVKQRDEPETPPVAKLSATAARTVALKKVEASLPSLCRQPLSFSANATPPLTVLLISQGNYLLDVASLTALHAQGVPGLQIIIIGSASRLARQRLELAIEGIDYFNSDEHLPLWQRVQDVLPFIRGAHILLIESGMQLLPMTLPAMMEALNTPHSGGSGKILAANNVVLEAGSTVCRDGAVTARRQGVEALAHSVSLQREIEAVQGGLLFCGYDGLERALSYVGKPVEEAFFTCLSMALRAVGERLVYWPIIQAKALHVTAETYAQDRITKEALRRIFPTFLPTHSIVPSDGDGGLNRQPQVMMIFQHLPRAVEGGPARRIMQHIQLFRQKGWRVMVVGLERGEEDRLTIACDYPADVDCWCGVKDIATFMQQHQARVKLFWLVGASSLGRVGPVLASGTLPLHDKAIMLDIVGQKGTGLNALEQHMRRLVGMVDEPHTLVREAQKELEYAWLCQGILAGDDVDAALLHRLGYGNVVQLPYAVVPEQMETGAEVFARRKGVLFPLPIYQAGDAGHDGFDWFCLAIMPHLQRHFKDHFSIDVGGYHHPSVDIGFYERMAPLDGFAETERLATVLKQCRVVMDPARVLAATAIEIVEAAAQGVPAIISSAQMERLGWKDGQEALDGGVNAPEHFAQQIIRLYEEPELWESLRIKAYEFVSKEHSATKQREIFDRVLEQLFQQPVVIDPAPEVPPFKPERVFAPAPLRIQLKVPPVPVVDEAEEDEGEDQEADDVSPLPTHIGVTLSNDYESSRDAQ